MTDEKDVDAVAERFLDWWIDNLSVQSETYLETLSGNSPEFMGQYRQWHEFYHSLIKNDPTENPVGFACQYPDFPSSGSFKEGIEKNEAGERAPEYADTSASAHDVSVDELAELKARLADLAEQIARLEHSPDARRPGKGN
ncbi:hypothetical protein [Kiloniella laminariae]|uniref:hypothetical protein n=1 Tax=Kiloniella laminariae TaxID=454162 RepID=UPI000370FF1A|nr:hypothetical protein [Kiloniella laminariae]